MTRRIDNLCSDHQRNPESGHRCATCHRIRTEMKILRRTVSALIKAGYFVSLNDGEETTVIDSTSVTLITAAAFTTDEDYLYARKVKTGLDYDYDYDAFVRFIYGNNGSDVINSYSTSLEPIMKPINDYCDTLETYA